MRVKLIPVVYKPIVYKLAFTNKYRAVPFIPPFFVNNCLATTTRDISGLVIVGEKHDISGLVIVGEKQDCNFSLVLDVSSGVFDISGECDVSGGVGGGAFDVSGICDVSGLVVKKKRKCHFCLVLDNGETCDISGDETGDETCDETCDECCIVIAGNEGGCNFDVVDVVDLSGIDIYDFSGGDASGCNFEIVDFSGGDASGCNFEIVDFSGGDASGCNFEIVDFSGGDASGCNFKVVDFSGGDASGCNFEVVDLSGIGVYDISVVDMNGYYFLKSLAFKSLEFDENKIIDTIDDIDTIDAIDYIPNPVPTNDNACDIAFDSINRSHAKTPDFYYNSVYQNILDDFYITETPKIKKPAFSNRVLKKREPTDKQMYMHLSS